MEGLLEAGEAVQGPVHAGGPHEEAHRGETSQVHGKTMAGAVQLRTSLNLLSGIPQSNLVYLGIK